MQRKRNIRLLISLVALIAFNVTIYLLLNATEDNVVDESFFKVSDFTKIDEVVLTQNGNTVTLKFDGSKWTVNNQLADRRMIDVLFATLQQAKPKRPVAESIQDSVNTVLDKEGVAVKLLSANETQKEFIVGGNSTKTQTYFKDKGASRSYIIVIPGYRVYVGGIFELEEGGWRDKYVFSFNWRNFQSLNLRAPSSPKNDFEVTMGKSYYEIKGIASVDTTKLNDFLDAVSLLTVDQYVKNGEVPNLDSINKTSPFIELQIKDVSGKGYSLILYEYTKGRFLGHINGSQLAFFDRKKLTAIAKSRNWFERK